jgi:hypothetical protein
MSTSHFKMFGDESQPISTAALVRKNLGFADDDAIESLDEWRDHLDEAHARLSSLREKDEAPTAEEIQSACSPLHALIGKMNSVGTTSELPTEGQPPVRNENPGDEWGRFYDDQQRGRRGERRPGDLLARSDQTAVASEFVVSHFPRR